MQRSRKALLRRRAVALERGFVGQKFLCKMSVPLVVLLWGLIFHLNLLSSHGNSYRDGPGATMGESSWHETQPEPNKGSVSGGFFTQPETISNSNDQKTLVSMVDDARPSTEDLSSKDIKLNLPPIEKKQVDDIISDRGITAESKTSIKSDRLSRVAPPGLDEFKSKAISAKEKHLSSQTGTVIHRVEPGGKEYNYASASKGAKVLAFNKEAKDPFGILDKNQDKYLRNPCSAEEKYVVIELSEETLVDTIEIANFEYYSSNLKDFELMSSLTYPSDNWVKIGNFTAGNVKHKQRFTLPESKWARYLKLHLLSHYGSEFYCTLSVVEVYGVDVVERMLEDLISSENKRSEPEEQNEAQMPLQESTEGEDIYQQISTQIDYETPKITAPSPVVDSKPAQQGRIPADTVLKILMQKVQSLDVNFSVLERYLEEMSSRYGHIFKEFDDDLDAKDSVVEMIRLAIKDLEHSKDIFASDISELLSWKSLVSAQMGQSVRDNAILRLEIERIRDRQVDMENKGLAVIAFSFVFGCLAAAKLFIGVLLTFCRVHNWENFCTMNSSWLVLLISSSIIAFILVL